MAKLNIHGVLAMMGRQSTHQYKLFMSGFSLEKRVRQDHMLRKVAEAIDFDFIYEEVEDSYGTNGNVSVPPPVILKMMLLLILYNVRSERELMQTIPERMDWMWFLGYDLDDEIPDHSVLSKARARWGVAGFRRFFERIVGQCVEAGLVDGSKLFLDASLLEADASNRSVVDRERWKKELQESYPRLEERLDDFGGQRITPANSRYISTTDPDASVIRHSVGQSKLRYKTHRGVDPQQEVITTTWVTPGSTDEGSVLPEMVKMHKENTGQEVKTAVADSRYGTIDNYLFCHDSGIQAHIRSLEETQRGSGRREDIFSKEAFHYDQKADTFVCPAGRKLWRRHFYKERNHYEYQTHSGVCSRCRLKPKCTRSQTGRTIKRHARQTALDKELKRSRSAAFKEDLKTRQHLSERSFARSVRYGYKRARWRGWWRVQIQDFLIATIQNIMVLITHGVGTLSKSKTWPGSFPRNLIFLIQRISFILAHYMRLASELIFTKHFGQQPLYS